MKIEKPLFYTIFFVTSLILFTLVTRFIPGYAACWLVEMFFCLALMPKGGKGFWIFGGRARSKLYALTFSILVLLGLILIPLAISPFLDPYLIDPTVDIAFGASMTVGIWLSVNKFYKH